jgi:predicted MFS family arabinose efflux permease
MMPAPSPSDNNDIVNARNFDAVPLTNARLQALGVLAAVLIGIAGVLVVGLKPLLVIAYIGADHFSQREAGNLVAIDMLGAMAGNLLGSWKLYARSRSAVASVGLLMILVGNLLSVFSTSFVTLGAARVVTGFGAGISASVMAGALSETSSPERFFALYSFAAFITSAGAMWLSGELLNGHGISSMFYALAAASLLPLVFVKWLPTSAAGKTTKQTAQVREGIPERGAMQWNIIFLLIGTVIFYCVTGGVYSFMAEMGLKRGISSADVNSALAASQIAAAAGSVVPFLLGDKLGRTLPIALALTTLIMCLPCFLLSTSPLAFGGAMSAFAFAWLAFFPYLMAVCAGLDTSGRQAPLNLAVQYGGLSIGPALAGYIAQRYGYAILVVGAAVGYVASGGLMLLVERRSRKL